MKVYYGVDNSPTSNSVTLLAHTPLLMDGEYNGTVTPYVTDDRTIGFSPGYSITLGEIKVYGKMGTGEPSTWYSDMKEFDFYISQDDVTYTLEESFDEPPLTAVDANGRGYFTLTLSSEANAPYFKIVAPNGVAWNNGGSVQYCEVVFVGVPTTATAAQGYFYAVDSAATSMTFDSMIYGITDKIYDLATTPLMVEEHSVGIDFQNACTVESLRVYGRCGTGIVSDWQIGKGDVSVYSSDNNSAWTLEQTFSDPDLYAIDDDGTAYFDLDFTSAITSRWIKVRAEADLAWDTGSGVAISEIEWDSDDYAYPLVCYQRLSDTVPTTMAFQRFEDIPALVDDDLTTIASETVGSAYSLGLSYNELSYYNQVIVYGTISSGTVSAWDDGKDEIEVYWSIDGGNWSLLDTQIAPELTAGDSSGTASFTVNFDSAGGKWFKLRAPNGWSWNSASVKLTEATLSQYSPPYESGMYSFSHDFSFTNCGFAWMPIEVKGGLPNFDWSVTGNFELMSETTGGRTNHIRYTGEYGETTAGEVTIIDATGNSISRPCYYCIVEPQPTLDLDGDPDPPPGSAVILMFRGTINEQELGYDVDEEYCFFWDLDNAEPLYGEIEDSAGNVVENTDWPVKYGNVKDYVEDNFNFSDSRDEDIFEFQASGEVVITYNTGFQYWYPGYACDAVATIIDLGPGKCTSYPGVVDWILEAHHWETTRCSKPWGWYGPVPGEQASGSWYGTADHKRWRWMRIKDLHTGDEWPYRILGTITSGGSGNHTRWAYKLGPGQSGYTDVITSGYNLRSNVTILDLPIPYLWEQSCRGGFNWYKRTVNHDGVVTETESDLNIGSCIHTGLYGVGIDERVKIAALARTTKTYNLDNLDYGEWHNLSHCTEIEVNVYYKTKWDESENYDEINPFTSVRSSVALNRLYKDIIVDGDQTMYSSIGSYNWWNGMRTGHQAKGMVWVGLPYDQGSIAMPRVYALVRK